MVALVRPGAGQFQEFRATGERLAGQSTSNASSTTIAFPGFLGVEGAMSVVSRLGFNVNADASPDGVAVEVGLASFEVGFSLFHPRSFDMILDFELLGELVRDADQSGCLGAISLADISIPTLERLRDGAQFPIDVVLAGSALELSQSNAIIPVSRQRRVTINFRGEPAGTEAYKMMFVVSATALSQSCEVSARFGALNGSTTGCNACEYPGFPSRDLTGDGIFITVTEGSLCGDGNVNAGEDCDEGVNNGTDASCCTIGCENVTEGRICRPAASECDRIETCSGHAGACPEDQMKSAGSACTSDNNDCTSDVCSPSAQCLHLPDEGASCQNAFFCDGGEFCSAQGQCVTMEPPPCPPGMCDEENDRCITPARCAGDCDGDAAVTINEIILGVNIALGSQPIAACTAFDTDADGEVVINEIIAAVSRALGGC